MYNLTRGIRFDTITSGVRALETHCDLIERQNAERHARLAEKNNCATDRLRWTLHHDVQCVVEREHVDVLLDELRDIAHGHALEMQGGPHAGTYDAVIEFALRWARYCNRTIADGFDRRADLQDQMIWLARVEHCRRMLEALDIADRHFGLADEDMRAVFEARAAREAESKAKAKRCEVVKLGGQYVAHVYNGHGDRMEEIGLHATRKPDALAATVAALSARGLGHITPAML